MNKIECKNCQYFINDNKNKNYCCLYCKNVNEIIKIKQCYFVNNKE